MLFFLVLETIEDKSEREKLQEVFEQHAKPIKLYIKKHFSLSEHDIEDAVSDVFMTVIKERDAFLNAPPDHQIKTLQLIARRVCLNKRKRNALESKLFTSLDELIMNNDTIPDAENDSADFTDDIAEQEINSQNIRFVIEYVSKMDTLFSTIFIMKFAHHQSNVQIARELHMNASTVGTILNRMMNRIRKELGVKKNADKHEL